MAAYTQELIVTRTLALGRKTRNGSAVFGMAMRQASANLSHMRRQQRTMASRVRNRVVLGMINPERLAAHDPRVKQAGRPAESFGGVSGGRLAKTARRHAGNLPTITWRRLYRGIRTPGASGAICRAG